MPLVQSVLIFNKKSHRTQAMECLKTSQPLFCFINFWDIPQFVSEEIFFVEKIQYSPTQRSLWMPPNVICSYYDKVETIWIWCVSEKRAHFNFTTCALLLGFGLRVVFGDLKPFFFVLSTHKNGPNSLNLWFCPERSEPRREAPGRAERTSPDINVIIKI